jgi:hypothetical protein
MIIEQTRAAGPVRFALIDRCFPRFSPSGPCFRIWPGAFLGRLFD